MLWLVFVTAAILLVIAVVQHLQKNEHFERIPGPKGLPIVQNGLDFLMDPVKLFYYLKHLSNSYRRMFKLKFGVKNIVVLYDPEDVEVLLSSNKNIRKEFLYEFLEPWLQKGLALSNGKLWQQRRKVLTPAFHFNILRNFHTILEENTWKFVEKLREEVGKPKTDVSLFISSYTLNSICETAMGVKLDEQANNAGQNYKNAIHELGALIVHRSIRLWLHPSWIFGLTVNGRKQRKVLHLLRSFRDNIIKNRREGNFDSLIREVESADENSDDITSNIYKKKKLAFLDLLLQAEKQGTIDAKGIGEEVDTFMFGGHDTTATALQFLFMSLANHPEAQEKARKEIDEIFGNSDRTTTTKDLGDMTYVEACIKEGMRLYPPVFFIMREITHDLQLKNYTVPAGTECAILIQDMQRRDDQFVEPLEFRPERFLTEPTWHPYCYVPFSAGPRNCIGQKFAMIEMKLAVSAVLRHFKLLPVTNPKELTYIVNFILRTQHPIYVKFENRDKLIN